MKNIKPYQLYESSKITVDDIKDILVDIKDKYPDIDGDILIIDKTTQIQLDCRHILLEGEFESTEYYRNKIKFINTILDVVERIERSYNIIAHLPNLDQFTHWQYNVVKISLFNKSNEI